MFVIHGFISICVIIFTLYAIGLLDFLSDFECKCEMTYMFEYPQFVKISNSIGERFAKYGLYAYSEGRFSNRARRMHFDGIPVLFIPGNGGSYRQVRSLSSVALRKALSAGSTFHFDYFTVDLNNELSGLYGPLIYDQLEYVNSTLYRIFDLYRKIPNKPDSIIIIGHSMGGVIAKKLVSEVKTNSVNLLITLAAPLKRPPIILDYHLDNFYKYTYKNNNDSIIITLSGGYLDLLVPPYLSNINEYNSLHAVTTNIPRCWIEANHVEIVWCKQIILAINRALFDSIDIKTKQISKNVTFLNRIFSHHLIQHNGIQSHKLDSYSRGIRIDYKGKWMESLLRQYSLEFLHGLKETHWFMVKLTSLRNHEMLTVLALNLESVNWVFACNANMPKNGGRVCTEAVHLTHLSEILPSVKYKRRYLQINMHDLRRNNTELTHVVVRASPSPEPVVFHVDVHSLDERRITVSLPNWWTLTTITVLEQTSEKAVHYELLMPQLQHVLQFYQLFMEPIKCLVQDHHASASLIIPWGNENQHSYFTSIDKNPLNLRLYTSRPKLSVASARVRIVLEPSCTYRIRIKHSIIGMLGQMARICTPLLITNIAVALLLILRYLLNNIENDPRTIFVTALKEGAKPYYMLIFVKVVTALMSGPLKNIGLPKPDILYLIEDGTDFFTLHVLTFLCSVGIVLFIIVIYVISLATMDSTINKIALKLARFFFVTGTLSDYLITILQKVPIIAVGVLIFISISTCGSLALCLGALFYYIKLIHMSQDCIEKITWFVIKNFFEKCKLFIKNKRQTSQTSLDVSEKSILESKSGDRDSQVEKLEGSDEKNKTDLEKLLEEDATMNKVNNKEVELMYNKYKKIDKVVENEKTGQPNDMLNEDELAGLFKSIFFHSVLFLLWCIIAIINLPAIITWAHNFKFSKTLSPDNSFVPGFTLSLCALPLWQYEFPNINSKWATYLGTFILIIATLCLIFAVVSVYRLSYLLTVTIVVITLYQFFITRNIVEIEDQDDKTENKFMDSKLKLN